jgi:hypothetical protein
MSYVTVLNGIRQRLFPSCSQVWDEQKSPKRKGRRFRCLPLLSVRWREHGITFFSHQRGSLAEVIPSTQSLCRSYKCTLRP